MLDEIEMGGITHLRVLVARLVGASTLAVGLCAFAVPPGGAPASPSQAEERPVTPAQAPGAAGGKEPAAAEPPRAEEAELAALDRVPESCWQELRGKRIYFVHRSVGDDLVKGMEDAMRERTSIGLRVEAYDVARREDERREEGRRREERRRDGEARTAEPPGRPAKDAFAAPGFIHADAGFHHADTKIDDFEEFLLSDKGARVDVAILKLCYKDFGRSTDTATLLQAYAQAVELVRRARPNLVIVHCTVPLREAEHGFRRAFKDAVGIGGDGANAARGRFNEAMRKRFRDEPMLDLARIESLRPDGTEAVVTVDGASWPALAKEYSEDGAHLNARGRLRAGVGMLETLASLCTASAEPHAATAAVGEERESGRE